MKNKKIKSPKIGFWLMCKIFGKDDHPTLIGDFEEIYSEIVKKQGIFTASFWYWSQIVKSLPSFIKNQIHWRFNMVKNYLKIAFRNIIKQKGFSLVNISGLAIGMACAILILLWIRHELSYDRFHDNAENISRVLIGSSAYGPGPLANVLEKEYPEIEKAARLWHTWDKCPLKYKDKVFFGSGFGVEKSFFDIFTFPFISGGPEISLSEPNFIILTENLARKCFGKKNPFGKTLKFEWWGKWYEFNVTGVIKNVPTNSFLQFDFLLPFLFVKKSGWNLDSWQVGAIQTYVLLKKNIQVKPIADKISDVIRRFAPESTTRLQLQPLNRIHLYHIDGGGPIIYIYIFSSIGIFILVIACINFMNLTTSRSMNRAKEVGMRKVIGSSRKQLIAQFLGESILLSFIALICAIILSLLLLPMVNILLGTKLKLYYSWDIFLSLAAIVFVTGAIAGSYPALYLSNFHPVRVLKGSIKPGSRIPLLRKFLVVSQFVISILLIICASIAFKQLDHMKNMDLGFDKEHIINLKLKGSISSKTETIKQELLLNPSILAVTFTNGGFSNNSSSTDAVDWQGKKDGEKIKMGIHAVDYDYQKTFGIKMVQGRFFSKEFSTDAKEAYVVNEAAVKAMGIESPLDKRFTWTFVDRKFPGRIIGVMKDFNFLSLHNEIPPLLLKIAPWWYNNMFIKLKSGNISDTIGFIERKTKKIAPDYPFEYSFLDEEIDRLYRTEQRAGALVKYGTFLAVFIACLGLFGLASFTAEQRTREIGIRKVLGASVPGIVIMLSKEFSRWVLAANIIAWPAAYFIMDKWLQSYAYRIHMGIATFILSGLLALLIALLTVGYQSVKVAAASPLEALKYE